MNSRSVPNWINRSLMLMCSAMSLIVLGGCGDSSNSAATAGRDSRQVAAAPAQAGTLIVTRADGTPAWTLRVDGNHVEVAGPDGARLIGDRRGDKRRYRRESDGNAVAEVKFSDQGFKLRTRDSQLLWKVKFGDEKIKISNNEQNQYPWVLKTGYSDKAKIMAPSESEIGEVRFQGERTKVKDAAGNEQYLIDTAQRSAAFGVLQMTDIPDEQRSILMVELLASGR